jgi:hypothetical protein
VGNADIGTGERRFQLADAPGEFGSGLERLLDQRAQDGP